MQVTDAAALNELFGRPAFARALDAFEAKIVQYGGPSGEIIIDNDEEAEALGGLLGRYLRAGQRIKLSAIEAHLLEETRFRCTLRQVVETVRGRSLITRAEARAAEEARWQTARTEILDTIARAHITPAQRSRLLDWAEAGGDLRRRWARDDRLVGQVADACRCFGYLPGAGQSRSLAELSNSAFGDPHMLDRDTSLAPVFDRILAVALDREHIAAGAEARDELLAAAGVVQDRTSAKVDTFGLQGRRPDLVLLRTYPLRSFTLRELEGMDPDEIFAPHGRVFVVENASVFDWLIARMDDIPADRRPSLICTNGWLNMADRALLRMLVGSGAVILYSGDFDDRGLAIAREVLSAVPGSALWRMDPADYQAGAASHSAALDVAATERLRQVFPTLVPVMCDIGRAVYQESLQEILLRDLIEGRSLAGGTPREQRSAASR